MLFQGSWDWRHGLPGFWLPSWLYVYGMLFNELMHPTKQWTSNLLRWGAHRLQTGAWCLKTILWIYQKSKPQTYMIWGWSISPFKNFEQNELCAFNFWFNFDNVSTPKTNINLRPGCQLQVLWNLQSAGHTPPKWRQVSVSFEAKTACTMASRLAMFVAIVSWIHIVTLDV